MSQIPRLYLAIKLDKNEELIIEGKQFHYLANVLRKKEADKFYAFNGNDGEYLCVIDKKHKKNLISKIIKKTKEATKPYNLHYLFAPIKKERLDYMMQKATEMGAGIIQPVITEYTQYKKLNYDRITANTIEAAEQCGIINIPKIEKQIDFYSLLNGWDKNNLLVFCDEFNCNNTHLNNDEYCEITKQPLNNLDNIRKRFNELRKNKINKKIAVIIGPEGGFSQKERDALYEKDFVLPISLGPRVMRSDTAAVAALSLIQSLFGDWYL